MGLPPLCPNFFQGGCQLNFQGEGVKYIIKLLNCGFPSPQIYMSHCIKGSGLRMEYCLGLSNLVFSSLDNRHYSRSSPNLKKLYFQWLHFLIIWFTMLPFKALGLTRFNKVIHSFISHLITIYNTNCYFGSQCYKVFGTEIYSSSRTFEI